MIALTFALPAESSVFVPLLENQSAVSREGLETIRGEYQGETIALVHTGVGAAAATRSLEIFLRRQAVDYLLSTGFAGGLDRDLKVGDLLIAENFSSADLLASPNFDLTSLRIYVGQLMSVERITDGEDERAALAEKNGAVAVDMETASIAKLCAKHKVPMISLRAISDTAAEPFPAPPRVLFDLEKQKTNAARLAFYLATHPARIQKLRTFAAQVASARESLTKALEVLLRRKIR